MAFAEEKEINKTKWTEGIWFEGGEVNLVLGEGRKKRALRLFYYSDFFAISSVLFGELSKKKREREEWTERVREREGELTTIIRGICPDIEWMTACSLERQHEKKTKEREEEKW